jgi:hypothetical protein
MGRKGKEPAEEGQLFRVQRVMPLMPADDDERELLRTALETMGCELLLDKAWGWRHALPAHEILVKNPENRGTIRGEPDTWTAQLWRETYGFKNSGEISTPETREFVWDYIKGPGDKREGWELTDIKNPEARRVVGFMNPIFHPEKPKRITVKWASVFIGAMIGEFTVDWGLMMKTIVDRQVANLRKTKKQTTCLPSFLIHLYRNRGLLSPKEIREYDEIKSIQQYAEPEEVSDQDEDDDVIEISPTPAKRPRPSPEKGQPSGSPRTPTPVKRTLNTEVQKPTGPPEHTGDPCQDLVNLSEQVSTYAQFLQSTRQTEARLAREVITITETDRLEDCLSILRRHRDLASLQVEHMDRLEKNREKILRLEQEVHDARHDYNEARDRAAEAIQSVVEIKATLALPVDVANQCAVYQAFLTRQPDPTVKKIVRFMHDRTQVMKDTWVQMKNMVEIFSSVKAGSSSEPPAGREEPRPPSPPREPAPAPPPASPIRSTIRSVQQEMGQPLEDPLPDTLSSLHTLPNLAGVETVNPGNIPLEPNQGPPPEDFTPVQGSPEQLRVDLGAVPVAVRSPSPPVQAGRPRKASDPSTVDVPEEGPSLKKLKRVQKKERLDGPRHSPRFDKHKE